jgi:hypothetical protein
MTHPAGSTASDDSRRRRRPEPSQGGPVEKSYTMSEYEALWQDDPQGYSGISIQLAIDSLQMDAAAVSMLIDKGALECFEIEAESGPCRMVTLPSLLRFKAARTSAAASPNRPQRILELLTEAARNQKTLLFGDAMQRVGLSYQNAMHRVTFKQDLREAARQCELYDRGLLISALLVFKIQHIPEDDFFLMAQELGMFTPGKDSKTVFFKEHLARIFQYYAEH